MMIEEIYDLERGSNRSIVRRISSTVATAAAWPPPVTGLGPFIFFRALAIAAIISTAWLFNMLDHPSIPLG
jgi:hypothetical protein